MLERDLEAAPDQPGVESVVAVLDQNGAPRKTKECPAHVPELGCADQHGSIDLVTPARVRVDGSPAVDQRVEERERAVEPKPFGPDLEHEEGRIAGGLDVQGYELGFIQPRQRSELGRVDRDLRPRHRLDGAARLEQDRLSCPAKFRISRGPLGMGHLASASALRANAISSAVTARSRRAAPAYTAAPTTIGMRIRSPSRLLSGSRAAPMIRPARIGRQLI